MEQHECEESEGRIPFIIVRSNGYVCGDCGKILTTEEVFGDGDSKKNA